jgi:TrmH family RNA methyltransferase
MEPVRHHRNPRVVEAARLHRARERSRRHLTLIEGPSVLEEAIACDVGPLTVFGSESDTVSASLCASRGLEWVPVTDQALQRLSGTMSPRGPIAVIPIPPAPTLAPERNVLVAWGVGDPGNLGTMLRTASSFGWDFAFSPGSADPWGPKALRAGAGAHFRTGVVPVTDLTTLQDAGLITIAAVLEGGVDPGTLEPSRFAVLIGEEAHGLPDDLVLGCDARATIPTTGGVESLNASAAAAILVYALSRHTRPDDR